MVRPAESLKRYTPGRAGSSSALCLRCSFMPLCQMFILSPILMHGGKAAESPQVAHTFRSLECMRHICDVEWRDAAAEALLRREPCSLFTPSAYRRVRVTVNAKYPYDANLPAAGGRPRSPPE